MLNVKSSFVPLDIIDPSTDKLMVPHPYDNWDWWEGRGFKVKEYNLGSIEYYHAVAFPRTTGDGLYKSLWLDYYRFEKGMEEAMTTLMYESGLGFELSWRIITRLYGAKKTTD